MTELKGSKGKGGEAGGGVREEPNTLQSTSKAKIVDLISEGEIGGLVNGAKSIYLNEVPLQNDDDSYNFTGFRWAQRVGTPDQTSVPGFSEAEATIGVGAEVKKAVPVSRVVDGSSVDAIRLTISVSGLQEVDQEAQVIKGTSVSLKLTWKTNPGGSEVSSTTVTISGKTNSEYRRSYYMEVPGSDSYILQVERLTDDSEKVDLTNGTVWYSYTEINESKFSYPDSALVAIEIDAQQFGSQIPNRGYRINGILVRVPTNYNPVTRVYTGIWDGTFKLAVTNNPAWIWFDLVTNDRYGLGEEVGLTNVDKWAVYNIGVYCDGEVDDGYGGTEPRFTFNGVIQEQREAYEVLSTLASVFRGMMYWGAGSVTLVQDSPRSPEIEVNQTRVVGGTFRYQKSAKKARHTAVFVTWNDPNNFGRPAVEVVEDRVGIATLGYRRKDIVLVGCTSRAMARRAGQWLLYTELNETETVSYVCHADHLNVRPGAVIRLSDPKRLGVRNAGRIAGVSGLQITLDKAYGFDAGETYQLSVIDSSGNPELVDVVNPGNTTTDVITLDSAPSRTPLVGEVFAILGSDLALPQYRVLSIREVEINEVKCYEVTALRHDPNKFAIIEQNISFPADSFTKLPAINKTEPANNMVLSRQIEVVSPQNVQDFIDISWSPSEDRYISKYRVLYKFDAEWQVLTETTTNSARIPFPVPGSYEIRVIALNAFGVRSRPLIGEITITDVSPVPVPAIRGLELFEKGISTEFEGKDAVFTWRRASGMAQSPGAERFGGDSSSTDPLFQNYLVQVYDTSGNLLRAESVTDNFYTYTYEKNFEDNAGVPVREFEVSVSYVNRYNQIGVADRIRVSNTLPVLPDVVAAASYREIFLDYDEPSDPDFVGMMVWASTSSPVAANDGNLVFKGRGKPSFSAQANTTYYYKYAVYDEFGTSGATVSSEAQVTTLEPIEDIPDGSITLGMLSVSVQNEINRVLEIGKSVLPPGMNAGAQGDLRFNINQTTSGSDPGEIEVTNIADDGGNGWFYHPTLGLIDETGDNGAAVNTPLNVLTPWEGANVPRERKFFVMYWNANASRFSALSGIGSLITVTYDSLNETWYAHDNLNATGVAFTPDPTDLIVAVAEKESVSGGIESIRSLVGNTVPLAQRVSATETAIGDPGDPASGSGSLYARIYDEQNVRLAADNAAAYRLNSIEASARLPQIVDVHPLLVFQWQDGTGSGDADYKTNISTSLSGGGLTVTATSSTGFMSAGFDLSTEQKDSVDWSNSRYLVVILEKVSSTAGIPQNPRVWWNSAGAGISSTVLATNASSDLVYQDGKFYTFVFDMQGSLDGGSNAWGSADPSVIYVSPVSSGDQTTGDVFRIHKISVAAYSDQSYAEMDARADIFQSAIVGDGSASSRIILQTAAGVGDSQTVGQMWVTSDVNPTGTAVSNIGFVADGLRFWNPNTSSNLPIFEISGTKISLNANTEIQGSLLVNGTVTSDAILSNTFTGREFNVSADITIGSGSRTVRLSGIHPTHSFWIGNADPALAGLSATPAGDLYARSLTLASTEGYELINPTTLASDLFRTQVFLGSGYRIRTLQVQLPNDTTDYDVTLEAETDLVAEGRFNVGGAIKTDGIGFPSTVTMRLYYRYNGGAWTQIGTDKTWTKTANQATYDGAPDDYYLIEIQANPFGGNDFEIVVPGQVLEYAQSQLNLPAGTYEYKVEVVNAASFPSQQRGLALTDTSGSGFQVADAGASVGSGGAPGGFLSLTDTPGSYAGQGRHVAHVNAAELAMQFSTISELSGIVNVQDYDISPANTASQNYSAWNTLVPLINSGSLGNLGGYIVLYFPPGIYQFSNKLSAPSASVQLVGAGQNATTIWFTSATVTQAGFLISPTTPFGMFGAQWMTVETSAAGADPAFFTNLNVSGSYANEFRVRIENIEFRGRGGTGGWWTYGWDALNTSYSIMRDCRIQCVEGYGDGYNGYYPGWLVRFRTTNVTCFTVENHVQNCSAHFAEGLGHVSGNCEGIYFTGNNGASTRYGIYAEAAATYAEPWLCIVGNHFAPLEKGIYINRYAQSQVLGNHIVRGTHDAAFDAVDFVGIDLGSDDRTKLNTVSGNKVGAERIPLAYTGTSYLIRDAGDRNHVAADNLCFGAISGSWKDVDYGIAVTADATSSRIAVKADSLSQGIVTKFSDAGTGSRFDAYAHYVDALNAVAGGRTYWGVATDQTPGYWSSGVIERDYALQDPEGNIRIAGYDNGDLVLLDKTVGRLFVSNGGDLSLRDSTQAERFKVNTTGAFVYGTLTTNSDIVFTKGSAPTLNVSGAYDLNVVIAGSTKHRFQSGGQFYATGSILAGWAGAGNGMWLGATKALGLFPQDDTDTAIYSAAADTWNFKTGGTQRLQITNASVAVVNVPLFLGRQGGFGGEVQFQGPTGGDRTFYARHALDGQLVMFSYDVSEATFENHLILNRGGAVQVVDTLQVGPTAVPSNCGAIITDITSGYSDFTPATNSAYRTLVVKGNNNGYAGITIASTNTVGGKVGALAFADEDNGLAGGIAYNHAANQFAFYINGNAELYSNTGITFHQRAGNAEFRSVSGSEYARMLSYDSGFSYFIGYGTTTFRSETGIAYFEAPFGSLSFSAGGNNNMTVDANRVFLKYQGVIIAQTGADNLRLMNTSSGAVGGKLRLQGATSQAEWVLTAGPTGGDYFALQNLTGTIHLLADAVGNETLIYGDNEVRLTTASYGLEVKGTNNNPIRLGEWSPNYSGLLDYGGHYLIMSGEEGGDSATYISGRPGAGIRVRAGANDNTNEYHVAVGSQWVTVSGSNMGLWTTTGLNIGGGISPAEMLHVGSAQDSVRLHQSGTVSTVSLGSNGESQWKISYNRTTGAFFIGSGTDGNTQQLAFSSASWDFKGNRLIGLAEDVWHQTNTDVGRFYFNAHSYYAAKDGSHIFRSRDDLGNGIQLVPASAALYLSGETDGDTYIQNDAANQTSIVTGALLAARFNTTNAQLFTGGNLALSTVGGATNPAGVRIDRITTGAFAGGGRLAIQGATGYLDWVMGASAGASQFYLVANGKYAIVVDADSSAYLYWNGSRVVRTFGDGSTYGGLHFGHNADYGSIYANNGNMYVSAAGSGIIRFVTGGSNKALIESSGAVYTVSGFLSGWGSTGIYVHPSAATGIYAAGDTDTGIKWRAADVLTAFAGNTEIVDFTTSGITARALATTGGSIILEGEGTDADWLWTQNAAQCTIGTPTYVVSLMRETNGDILLYYAGAKKFQTTSTGITVTGAVVETSDRNVKFNIEDLESGIDLLRVLRPREYVNNLTGKFEQGFIAQEVEPFAEWLVEKPNEDTDLYSMNYRGLIAPLVQAVVKLDDEKKALESELEDLKSKMKKVMAAIGMDEED